MSISHPSFRIVSTASKSIPLRDWPSAEHANMFFPVLTFPMDSEEESALLLSTGCPKSVVSTLIRFAIKYRESMPNSDANAQRNVGGGGSGIMKNRKLGTRSLLRIAKRIAVVPWDDDLYMLIRRAVLADFLPPTEKMALDTLFTEVDVIPRADSVSVSSLLDKRGANFRSSIMRP